MAIKYRLDAIDALIISPSGVYNVKNDPDGTDVVQNRLDIDDAGPIRPN